MASLQHKPAPVPTLSLFYALCWAIPVSVFGLLYFWRAPLEWFNGRPFDPATLLAESLQNTGYKNVDLISIGAILVDAPATIVVPLYALAPTIAAFIVVFAFWGRAGGAQLVSSLRPVRTDMREGLKAYGYLLLGLVAVAAFGLFLSEVQGRGADIALANLAATPVFGIGGWLIYATLFDEGGTLEELGWRGFAQPFLVDRIPKPLVAIVLLGTLWSMWHLPIRLTSPFIMNADIHWSLVLMILWLGEVCVSIVVAFFLFRTGGSVWPAIIIHGFTNNMNTTFASIEPTGDAASHFLSDAMVFRIGIAVGAAFLVLAVSGTRLGLRGNEPQWMPRKT